MLFVIVPLLERGLLSLKDVPQAANDIGAINYLADIKNLDLWGLASLEVAKAARGHYYEPELIVSLLITKKVKVAIVYNWLNAYGGIPVSWVKVGEWKISNN